MPLLPVLVFIATFAITALLLTAAGASKQLKETLGRLNAALLTDTREADEEPIDIRKQELLGSIPLLNRWLARIEVTPRVRQLLQQADLAWTPAGLILSSVVFWIVSGFLIYLRTGAWVVGLLLGMAAAAAPFLYILRRRAKRFARFEEALPPVLDMIVSALRSGHSLVSAVGLVAQEAPDPIGPEFRVCFDEQNYGLDLRTAMENLAVRVPLQDVRFMTTAILIQRETGGNLAEILEKCAQVIRDRFRIKREIRVRTAQGRLTGWILSILPVVLGIILYLISPQNVSLLWTRPLGQKMLYTAVVMTATGAFIIRKIVRIRT